MHSEPQESTVQNEMLLGHPVGLYTLFFAEMWERFSYDGMRALLVFYMIKGFLSYNDERAYGIYGAYTALVYATPFIGGMLADRLLGARRAVVLGGLLMACGHLMMTVEQVWGFYLALGLLIVGNGFFKPNISTIVGKLYPPGSPRRDGGFTIFYMGINLGAGISPLLCGYVGEKYGWHLGFGLATIGMLVGVAVFVAPIRLTQFLIFGGAVATAIAMLFIQNNIYQLIVNIFVGVALVAAAIIAYIALGRGGVPTSAGGPPDRAALQRKIGPFSAEISVYLAVLLSVPLLAMLVQNSETSSKILLAFGGLALVWMIFEAMKRSKVERERLFVVLILTFFSMLFWAFFEQAGSSMNNFADRNIDRVFEERTIGENDIGSQVAFSTGGETDDPELHKLPALTQEQLGRHNDDPDMVRKIGDSIRFLEANKESEKQMPADKLTAYIDRVSSTPRLSLTGLLALRDAARLKDAPTELRTLNWKIAPDNVGMGVGGAEIPASLFQAVNPIYILLFGIFFTMLWPFLAARGLDPSTPFKFALALMQLGLGFGALWYGAQHAADGRGMVAMPWLLLGILLHTTGELCSSPIGLSMITKLSPVQMVSTVMGIWFLGMAIANDLAAQIAKLTGVGGEQEGPQVIPPPSDTVHIYGNVFGNIAISAFIAALVCLVLSPLLTKWMHTEVAEQ